MTQICADGRRDKNGREGRKKGCKILLDRMDRINGIEIPGCRFLFHLSYPLHPVILSNILLKSGATHKPRHCEFEPAPREIWTRKCDTILPEAPKYEYC